MVTPFFVRGDFVEKLYFNNPCDDGPTAIFITNKEKCNKPVKLLEAGTRIYSISELENNHVYEKWKKYDIHFIFTNNIPAPDFYSVPLSYVFATDSFGGFYVTVREVPNVEASTPVCYISKDKVVYYIADSIKEFLSNPNEYKNRKYTTDILKLYKSLDKAKEENTFVDINFQTSGLFANIDK